MGKTEIIKLLTEHFLRMKVTEVVILTDENVEKYYASYFSELSQHFSVDKMVMPAGEPMKSIDNVIFVWNHFIEKQYDRNVFLLNFGGGTVCDLGGFIASTYKRGIRYANIPTTLLAMIDAGVGGKTGINLSNLKNGIGTFYFPDIQIPADISLLGTLPEDEFRSGFGELVKYALIDSPDLFHELSQLTSIKDLKPEFLDFCVDFKQKIVEKDPKDNGLRHILNYGHTMGHAIESFCAEQGSPMAHGIAVAQGLYYESLLSTRFCHLPQDEWQQISVFLQKHFQIMPITEEILSKLIVYMQNDKKNHDGNINFTLLDHIGHAIPDFHVPISEIYFDC